MPKGVLWRQHDIFMSAFGGRNIATGELTQSYDEIAKRVTENPGTKILTLPPLMHGAAQWSVMTALTTGQSVVFSATPSRFDADEVVDTIEREKVLAVQVVGDAMARPLADAIERSSADLSSLAAVANGGAYLEFDGTHHLVGDEVRGSVTVTVPERRQDLLDRGPFYGYLVPTGSTIVEGRVIGYHALGRCADACCGCARP